MLGIHRRFLSRDRSIYDRVRGLIGIIFALALGVALIAVWQSTASSRALRSVSADSSEITTEVLPLMRTAGDLRRDVIQVQQFLTDISATRAENGLNDGFEDAADYAAAFKRDMVKARALATGLDDTRLIAVLDELDREFTPFYASGQKMAHAYIRGGTSAGNRTMRQFDDDSLALQASADRLVAITDQLSRREVGELSEATGSLGTILTLTMTLTGLGCALLIGASVVASRHVRMKVAVPLVDLAAAIDRASDGNAGLSIADDRSGDEIGTISRALAKFQLAAATAEAERAARQAEQAKLAQERADHAQEALASQQRFDAERQRRADQLARAFEATVGEVTSAVSAAASQLEQAAAVMANTMHDANVETAKVASSSQQAFVSVETVASATDELSHSINEIVLQVMRQSDLSDKASTTAQRGSDAAEQLEMQARSIDEIVTFVRQLSGQTGMLALNATIEAARAGVAGQGFAVVAGEVKNLAEKTGQSAEEISGQVVAVNAHVATTSQAMIELAQSLQTVRDIASAVSSSINLQRHATEEISRSAGEAVLGTQAVARSIDSVRGAIESAAATASQLNAAADDLSRQSSELKARAGQFLAELKAA